MIYKSYWDILPNELKRKIKEYKIHYSSKILDQGINWVKTTLYEEKTIMNGVNKEYSPLAENINIPYSLDFEWFVTDYVYNSVVVTGGIEENDKIICDEIGYTFRANIFKKFNLLRILYRNNKHIDLHMNNNTILLHCIDSSAYDKLVQLEPKNKYNYKHSWRNADYRTRQLVYKEKLLANDS